MTGFIGLVMVFVAMGLSTATAHYWFGVPQASAALLGMLMWPVVERAWWLAGVVMYIAFVVMLGS